MISKIFHEAEEEVRAKFNGNATGFAVVDTFLHRLSPLVPSDQPVLIGSGEAADPLAESQRISALVKQCLPLLDDESIQLPFRVSLAFELNRGYWESDPTLDDAIFIETLLFALKNATEAEVLFELGSEELFVANMRDFLSSASSLDHQLLRALFEVVGNWLEDIEDLDLAQALEDVHELLIGVLETESEDSTSAPKYCSQCGSPVSGGVFCASCGAKLT
jgi:hypothetical protein